MTQISVGKDIVCYCGRCKLDLGHTIVAMIGSNVSKVQCRTCGSSHGMRKNSSLTNTKKTTSPRKRAIAIPVSQLWSKALEESSKRAKAYSIREKFEREDIIDHPKFGHGIVQGSLGGDKIEVLFQNELKVLVHNKN